MTHNGNYKRYTFQAILCLPVTYLTLKPEKQHTHYTIKSSLSLRYIFPETVAVSRGETPEFNAEFPETEEILT